MYDATTKAIIFNKTEGSLSSKFHQLKIMLHGFGDIKTIKQNGIVQNLQDDFASFLTPVSVFDPQGSSNPVEGYKVKSFVIKNDDNKITINY